jgi:transcriptional regulator with XRE-family HTH domain
MQAHTPIELFVIQRVKEERLKKAISQDTLSVLMGLSKKFVSKAENPNRAEKYNLNHLYKIALILECGIREFLPENTI